MASIHSFQLAITARNERWNEMDTERERERGNDTERGKMPMRIDERWNKDLEGICVAWFSLNHDNMFQLELYTHDVYATL